LGAGVLAAVLTGVFAFSLTGRFAFGPQVPVLAAFAIVATGSAVRSSTSLFAAVLALSSLALPVGLLAVAGGPFVILSMMGDPATGRALFTVASWLWAIPAVVAAGLLIADGWQTG
jgi:hypothetical protein